MADPRYDEEVMPRRVALQGAQRRYGRTSEGALPSSGPDKSRAEWMEGRTDPSRRRIVSNPLPSKPGQSRAEWMRQRTDPHPPTLSVGMAEPSPDPTPAPSSASRPEREAQADVDYDHALTTAEKARDDPSAGTAQGANQRYTGTGDTQSKTAGTGGVTTGAPGEGGQISVGLPGGEMMDYDPDDPSQQEAFSQLNDRFMEHSERAAPTRPGQIDRKGGPDSVLKRNLAAQGGKIVGPQSGTGQGASYTIGGDIPEATQIANWDAFLKMQDAEQQTFRTGMAKSEAEEAQAGAETVRSEMLTDEPFIVEETEAKGKIGVAEIEAATEIAGRTEIKQIVSEAAAEINRLRSDARFMSMPSDERERIEDQIWDQARLALSGLTETNLYPRPDPYAWLQGMNAPPPPEEK